MYTLLVFDGDIQGDICMGSLAFCLYELSKCINNNMGDKYQIVTQYKTILEHKI